MNGGYNMSMNDQEFVLCEFCADVPSAMWCDDCIDGVGCYHEFTSSLDCECQQDKW